MINLAVFNLKSIIKKIIKIFLFIIILSLIISKVKLINLEKINIFSTISLASTENIEKNISIAKYFDDDMDEKESSNIKKLLESEFALFSTISEEEIMELENKEEIVEFEENIILDTKDNSIIENVIVENNISDNNLKNENTILNEEKELAEIPEKVQTTVINTNNKQDKYTDIYKTVRIKNESKYTLTESMVTPDYELINKKDIILFHTHTCESYKKTENSNYEESGNFRTINLNYNVAAVGSELRNILTKEKYNVIHNVSYHDYPAYTGSYSRSLKTVKGLLEKTPNAELIIDIHRDALGSNSNYAPSVKIGEEVVAQLMFVIGTDGGGLEHPNWNNNLKTAIKIQEKANEMYPGLFKPIILRNSRYNQNTGNGAVIIEVGATGNTIEECKGSMKYLAKVLIEVLK